MHIMQSRRDFLTSASLAAAGILGSPGALVDEAIARIKQILNPSHRDERCSPLATRQGVEGRP